MLMLNVLTHKQTFDVTKWRRTLNCKCYLAYVLFILCACNAIIMLFKYYIINNTLSFMYTYYRNMVQIKKRSLIRVPETCTRIVSFFGISTEEMCAEECSCCCKAVQNTLLLEVYLVLPPCKGIMNLDLFSL